MRSWLFSAANTHLYPGATLRRREDAEQGATPAAGDRVLIEFADQNVASAEVVGLPPAAKALLQKACAGGFAIRVQPHTTARGAPIDSKGWLLQWLDDGALKVKARV